MDHKSDVCTCVDFPLDTLMVWTHAQVELLRGCRCGRLHTTLDVNCPICSIAPRVCELCCNKLSDRDDSICASCFNREWGERLAGMLGCENDDHENF